MMLLMNINIMCFFYGKKTVYFNILYFRFESIEQLHILVPAYPVYRGLERSLNRCLSVSLFVVQV